MVTTPDIIGVGSLAPCGMVTWPGTRRPPDGGLYKYVYIYR